MENVGRKIKCQAVHFVRKVDSATEALSFVNGHIASKYV